MPLTIVLISEKLGTYEAKDTTRIADEAVARGHRVFEVNPGGVSQVEGLLMAAARSYHADPGSEVVNRVRLDLSTVDVIHFRPNPPVDMAYLTIVYLLERIKDQVLIINSPESILRYPEKIFPLEFPDFVPPTLISRDVEEILAFSEAHGDVVMKPLYEFAGRGVRKYLAGQLNAAQVAARLAADPAPTVTQAFLRAVGQGDKRILFIGGEVAGAFVRIPKAGSYLANIAQGATIHPTTLTLRERELAARLGPMLVERGIYICGIDVIGETVTEINITSSVGFSQIEELYGRRPQVALWDLIERDTRLRSHARADPPA